ncbi:type III effector HrpK [Pseudomonas syringae]|uniref:pectate lyase n=1 Tax=Pseudomonas syringae TaxID=317 RepID=UPI001F37E0E2|nr:pectate lyase [Pseudomonas syringae]MCF5706573.1 type III effector HrpK [Pseudomonas syringae]
MSIGLSSQSYSPQALDFSALNGSGLQHSPQAGQNEDPSIDAGALLFNSGTQRNVDFGKPETHPLDSPEGSTSADDLKNMLQQFKDTISSLFQMLAKLLNKQDNANDPTQDPNDFQNDGGLGSEPTGGGDGGGTPEATGGDGGGTPEASGGDGGGTPEATGGDGGGIPEASGGGDGTGELTGDAGGDTPSATGNENGNSPSVTNPSSGPSSTSGTGATSGVNPVHMPKTSGETVVVNETIKVGPGETFDGGGKTFTAGSALGNGDQSENQKPLFELAEGATLKNVNLGENEADGIHVNAANDKPVTIQNLHAANVGEDLITVKGEGGAKVTNLNILDSSAKGADDKIIQLNANTHLHVDGFKADDFGTLCRTNGGKQFSDMALDLNNIDANHGKFALVKSDSEDLKLTTGNIAMTDVKHAYDKTKASTQHTEL